MMNRNYHDLYKALIKAYYDGHFEDEFERLLSKFENKEEAKKVLCALCGAEEILDKDGHEFVFALINYKDSILSLKYKHHFQDLLTKDKNITSILTRYKI